MPEHKSTCAHGSDPAHCELLDNCWASELFGQKLATGTCRGSRTLLLRRLGCGARLVRYLTLALGSCLFRSLCCTPAHFSRKSSVKASHRVFSLSYREIPRMPRGVHAISRFLATCQPPLLPRCHADEPGSVFYGPQPIAASRWRHLRGDVRGP